MLVSFRIFNKKLQDLPNQEKLLINTINAHSYNISRIDPYFNEALAKSDVLIPDGVSIIWAIKWLTGKRLQKIAGADLFFYELERLERNGGKCFFLGSTDSTLEKIKDRLSNEYPKVQIKTYSPPFKAELSDEDNFAILQEINTFQPDVLMVGMTAPKQEKWAYSLYPKLNVGHICCIGAVFDFYAGTVKRAPQWMINIGFEWLYRLVKEPKRLWRRYLIGNLLFIWYIIKEKARL